MQSLSNDDFVEAVLASNYTTSHKTNEVYFQSDVIHRLHEQMPDLHLIYDENDAAVPHITTEYVLPQQLVHRETFSSRNSFSVMHHNVRSLSKNFDQLKLLLNLSSVTFSVIGLCETWLHDPLHSLVCIDGYTLVSKDRTRKHGGGVALFVKDDVKFNVMETFCQVSI